MERTVWIEFAFTIVFGLVCGQVALEPVVPVIDITSSATQLIAGESASVHCKVTGPSEEYYLFWMKKQGSETVQVGTNNVLSTVFSEIGRYRIETIQETDGSVTFSLYITDAQHEDTGEIGCVIPQVDDSLKTVTLDVLAPVTGMKLYSLASNTTEGVDTPIEEYQDGQMVLFHIGETYYFGCTTKGSNPAPTFTILLGEDDITEKFRLEDEVEVSGPAGMGRVSHISTMITNTPVHMDYYSKAMDFKCTAHVPTYTEQSIHIRPKMEFAPMIDCGPIMKAPMFESGIEIRCNVLAMPDPTSITWSFLQLNKHPKYIEDGHGFGAYTSHLLTTDVPGQFVAVLHIARTFPQHFRSYTLNATNGIGSSEHIIELLIDPNAAIKDAASATQMSLSLVLMLLFVAIYGRT